LQIEIKNLHEQIPPSSLQEQTSQLQLENNMLRSKLEELGVFVENGAPLAGHETDVGYL